MSPRVRAVCLSDLHFGEEDSLLTALRPDRYECDGTRPSPVCAALTDAIRTLIDPADPAPSLVLDGDILELAFASYAQSLESFERFIERVVGPGDEVFADVLFVPGNHDHHVWEIARETQYVNKVLRHHRDQDKAPPPMHATKLGPADAVPSFLLDPLMRHVRGIDDAFAPLDYPVRINYPNLAFRAASGRTVVFHHGHYLESLYMTMSALRRKLFPEEAPPATVAQLEGENWAFINFVWSMLGRSGDAGQSVEVLYKRLQYPMNIKTFIDDLAKRIAEAADIPLVPGDWLEKKVLQAVFHGVARRLTGERVRIGESDEQEFERGLERYLYTLTYRQLEEEFGEVPQDLAFVSGHTHKPFEGHFTDPRGVDIEVYNTGGWAIDNADRQDARGGSIVLLDQDLQVVAIRAFHDGTDEPEITVEAISEAAVPFKGAIEARMASHETAWATLAETITREAAIRRDHIRRLFGS